jgi:probable HAF family extracellular repeat protein
MFGMKRDTLKIALTVILSSFLINISFADNLSKYTVTILEPNRTAYPYCINDSSQIVGTYGDDSFLWDNGNLTIINKPVGTSGMEYITARAINNNGQITGEFSKNYSLKGFVLENSTLITLPSIEDDLLSSAHSINNKGYAVGRAQRWAGAMSTNRACLWSHPEYNAFDISTVPNTTFGLAYSINDNNEIVGYFSTSDFSDHAFIYDYVNGMKDIGVLPGYSTSRALSINNNSQAVGYSSNTSAGRHAFFYDNNTDTMTDIGVLQGAVKSTAYQINDNEIIVGISTWSDNSTRGCIWIDGQIYDFNGLLFNPNWTITIARSINKNGRIVGKGLLGGLEYAVLLTPLGRLDNDSDVDNFDYVIFSSNWKRTDCNSLNNWCNNADFDRNGNVNNADLSILCANWLEGIKF